MPKIPVEALPAIRSTSYPAPFAALMAGRSVQRLGDAGGLTQFGVNLVRLEPGAISALRHWHEKQDEFAMVTEGALTLIDDSGETPLAPGDCCAFPAGEANGHQIVNRSEAPGAFLVIGTRTPVETGWYTDVDLRVEAGAVGARYLRRDGSALAGDEGGS